MNIKRIFIRLLQALFATPSLLAGFHALAGGGKAAGSAWSQHLLEALLIITVLEWVLRHDWSEPTVHGLTEHEWAKLRDELLRREASERARALAGD